MTMAVTGVALIGAMGLAIDVGHIFIVKNETQSYVDAAAIAAALKLDGTTAGITRANSAATSLSAHWNFDSATLTTPTVEFAALQSSSPYTCSSTWYATANVTATLAPTMICARVTKTVAPHVYFVPMVMASAVYSTNVQSQAVAGQVDFSANTSIVAGLGPFTGVAACSGTVSDCEASSPNFGLTVGNEYDIQWPQYNSNRKNCGNGKGNGNNGAANCFVSSPCPGDVTLDNAGGADPMQEVVQSWGSSINGYWGSNSTSQLNSYILDTQQLASLAIGTNIDPSLSSGNKQGTAKILDDRVNEDVVNYDISGDSGSGSQKLADYLANSAHNGRRMMPIPMVYPDTSSSSPVVGYGQFLLISNVSATGSSDYYASGDGGITSNGTGNDPYCAIYAGAW
ncbi:MAG TPA: pilus assembly protein TadG-related protein, partial [Bryobacteraceae bacterium]